MDINSKLKVNSFNVKVISTSLFIKLEAVLFISLMVKVTSVAKQAQGGASGLILCT